MMLLLDAITASTSIALRLGAYVFLRWIPGHLFPPAINGLLAVYLTSFVTSALYLPDTPDADDTSQPQATKDGLVQGETAAPRDGSGKKKPAEEVWRSLLGSPSQWYQLPILRSLLGLPCPGSGWLKTATGAINVVLALIVADVVYRGPLLWPSHDLSFARAGYVSDTTASVLIREPDHKVLPVILSYRNVEASKGGAWKVAGTLSRFSNETDFTSSMTIAGLKPETRYQYATSTNHSGSFVTAPRPGQHSHRGRGAYTFVTSSCLKPRFPWSPLSHPLSIPGLRHLAKWVPELQPQFMLFLGDFIYIDVPRRFGTSIEDYRLQYRMTYNSPDWYPASRYTPWIHELDDHEVSNDWDRNATGVYAAAVEPWHHYHVSVNPPAVRAGAPYFSFTQGPASFFMLDTRRYRSSEEVSPPDAPKKTMLGPEQLADLSEWLRKPPAPGVRWKIVASSVPLTKNWKFNTKDTWGGYLFERAKVLEAMWDARLHGDVGVVVLSGDRHEFAATAFPPPKGGRWPQDATVHEYSTSPLSQFYIPKPTYKQTDEEDRMIRYIPNGISKFGAIEITGPHDGEQSRLTFRLFIDGNERWSHVLTVP